MHALPAPALAFINHVLAQSDWAQERLRPFAGRVARIDMAPFDVGFMVANDGLLDVFDSVLFAGPVAYLWFNGQYWLSTRVFG